MVVFFYYTRANGANSVLAKYFFYINRAAMLPTLPERILDKIYNALSINYASAVLYTTHVHDGKLIFYRYFKRKSQKNINSLVGIDVL